MGNCMEFNPANRTVRAIKSPQSRRGLKISLVSGAL